MALMAAVNVPNTRVASIDSAVFFQGLRCKIQLRKYIVLISQVQINNLGAILMTVVEKYIKCPNYENKKPPNICRSSELCYEVILIGKPNIQHQTASLK